MMTNKQHDDLWMAAFEVVPSMAQSLRYNERISASLRKANALTIAKELYSIGEMSKEEYKDTLVMLLKSEGFTVDKK